MRLNVFSKISSVLLIIGYVPFFAFAATAPVVSANPSAPNGASTEAVGASSGVWQSVDSSDANSQNNRMPSAQKVKLQGATIRSTDQASSSAPQMPAPSASLTQRVSRVEQQVSNFAQMNLPQQLNDLQQKTFVLQGQLEVDQHKISLLEKRQQLYYKDLEQQVVKLQ